MESNFFRQLSELNIVGDLTITIAQNTEDQILVVSVLVRNDHCGDNAKNLIPPLTLRGTAEELDEGFFSNVTQPLKTSSALMVNMDAFLKQQEQAKLKSAMEKEKGEKARKETEAREKKYTESMQKADALESEGKFKEAWMKVPDPAEYPEHTDTIRKRREELSRQFQPDLFNAKESV